jgi:hypothetical protein
MSASPHNAYCENCEEQVDSCECRTCTGDLILAGCGVFIARCNEPWETNFCDGCLEKRQSLERWRDMRRTRQVPEYSREAQAEREAQRQRAEGE